MLYRPPVRRSRAGVFSRHVGGLAVPILGLTLLIHRADLIDTPQALVLIGLVFLLGAAAVVTAAIGLAIVWERGFLGARDAALGIVYGLVAIAPVIYGVYAGVTHPALNDISTDWADPPLFHQAALLRVGRMNSMAPPSDDKIELQKRTYPDLTTRRFGIGTEQLFGAAKKVVDRNGWKVLETTVPKQDTDSGRIEAVARTQVLGAANDVVIRIMPEPTGARIDVRSSSRYGRSDLGQNASRIRSYFTALDLAVAESFGQ